MKQAMPLSIVVPIYNMEPFLSRCIDSILAQTFGDFEIICVNDGSTDASQKIIDDYAAKDGRIKIITKENGGQTSARKAGVRAAMGDFIGFVDADDWIDPFMYERLYGVAVENGVDFVNSDYCQEGNYTAVSRDAVEGGIYKGEEMQGLRNNMILHLQKRDKGLSGALCTKLFRREILQQIIVRIPNEIMVSEDKVTMISYLLECDSAVVLHESYYHYVIHEDSMLNKVKPDYLLNVHHLYKYFRLLYNHPRFTHTMRIQSELYITQFLIKGINSYLGFANPNMLWIDPYWLRSIPNGSRVVLCGAGALVRKYRQQLEAEGKHVFAGWFDFNLLKNADTSSADGLSEILRNFVYDYIVIAVKNENFATKVRERLIDGKVSFNKILWFRQEEIFWKFAEADGLLKQC